MTIPSNYMIYVAKDGKHMFDIETRSGHEDNFKKVLKVMTEKFPESEGYTLLPNKVECISYGINTQEFLNS